MDTRDNTSEECQQASVERTKNREWGKCLMEMPLFSIREIEQHRQASGKGNAIGETLDRGRKFKEERYLSADSLFTLSSPELFKVKAKCKASMKKEVRDVEVSLNHQTSLISDASCSCPAGKSGYCNHVMALRFELADYSLHQLKTVPEELACTSKERLWGVPGQKCLSKQPVMITAVKKCGDKRGINCTLYDPRLNDSNSDTKLRSIELQNKLQQRNSRIGFAQCIDVSTAETIRTKFGEFIVGSTLSHQLAPLQPDIIVLSNISEGRGCNHSDYSFVKLPLVFLAANHASVPTNWEVGKEESDYLKKLQISEADSYKIEKDTIQQNQCSLWHKIRKQRVTASIAHILFVHKRNFEALANQLLKDSNENALSERTRDNFKHGRTYEPIARKQYADYMKIGLKHSIDVRETGIVVQPKLFWLAASPDGLITDKTGAGIGLIEIKCPKTKKDCSPTEIVNDTKFYITLVDGKPSLRKNHARGYYSQVQMAMGLAGASFCDFVVYTFKGLIIVRTYFDNEYFLELVDVLNSFYKAYMLPKLLENEKE